MPGWCSTSIIIPNPLVQLSLRHWFPNKFQSDSVRAVYCCRQAMCTVASVYALSVARQCAHSVARPFVLSPDYKHCRQCLCPHCRQGLCPHCRQAMCTNCRQVICTFARVYALIVARLCALTVARLCALIVPRENGQMEAGEYRRKVDAVTRCSCVCPHT